MVTDSSKEPSKGAINAARGILDLINEGNPRLRTSEMAELIDRETKAGEMADLLRTLVDEWNGSKNDWRLNQFMYAAERLLTDLEVKP